MRRDEMWQKTLAGWIAQSDNPEPLARAITAALFCPNAGSTFPPQAKNLLNQTHVLLWDLADIAAKNEPLTA